MGKLALAAVLSAGLTLALDAPKPPCNGKNRGQFWPNQANTDPKLAHELTRSGELEICTSTPWRHRWMPVSVRIQRPAPAEEHKTPTAPQGK